MIAFGVAISEAEAFRRYTQPGIELAREPDSAVLAFAAVDSVARSNNLILEAAAREPGLEALVLLHPHAEITHRDFCAKVRYALADPDVAVIGAAGARSASIAWWDGEITAGHVVHAYTDYGGGELPAFSWGTRHAPPAEVDAVDPWVLVLSRWAVENLRFDEELVLGHGAEIDVCWAARAAGKKVAVADLSVREHRTVALVADLDLWVEAHIAVARKWRGAERTEDDWCARARRGEAEREAERALAYFERLGYDARIEALERELQDAMTTLSWRLTQPLRTFNHWRRKRTAVRAAG
jgi:hypothetical protein